MTRFAPLTIVLIASLLACGEGAPEEDEAAPADTVAEATLGGGAGTDPAVGDETTTGGDPTVAASADATGAPTPPGGYAVDSRPAEGARLARIEYASPMTVAEVAQFYDSQINAARRVEVDVAGDNLVAYGLGANTTMGAATTAQDIERLLGQRSEPIVVIGPWQMQRNDPLLRDLRDAGLNDEADQLMNTKSKVTVIYAVRR
ncbi:MAG TPA: hypothetical protein VM778_08250 [Gemmatimonadota bacterium]|nr:hypothetical protein [Gemmatimonadota bacterium]